MCVSNQGSVRGCLVYTACLVCVFAVKSSYLGTSPIVMDAKHAASWLVGLCNITLNYVRKVRLTCIFC